MKNKAIKQELLFLIILGLIWRPLFFNDTYAGETKNITLLYTGSTHAMIYPCRCPIEPDGGVARRATLFKRLKKSYPSALILDTGNFVAGGPEDEYAQAPVLDAYRTLTNIRAMEIMGYDAAAVGDDEFNLGLDFFRQNIANAKFNLLSANLQEKNISPYMIAEVSGVKIGVIGLTNIVAAKKIAELKINNPKDSLVSAIDETRRKGAAIIVVLSNMGESEDVKLLSEVSGIDILIVGNAHLSANPFSQMGKTIVLRTGWKGRQVGKITFQWQDNRISHFKVEELRVYPQLKDDAEVLKILPRCFDNSYCKKEGFAGICENPGTMQSQCVFREADKIRLFVLTKRNCITCTSGGVISSLKERFPGLKETILYYPEDKQAQQLAGEFFISMLPAYLLGREADKQNSFSEIKDSWDDRGEFYVLKPSFSGIEYFLSRPIIKGRFDIFLSLYDKDVARLLEVLKGFNPTVHFLARVTPEGFVATGDQPEVEEYLRSVCIQKYYPEYFWDYLICRAKNINSSWWEDCLSATVDRSKIKSCATGKEGAGLLGDNISLTAEIQASFGPVYMLDNQQIFSSKNIPSKEELQKILER